MNYLATSLSDFFDLHRRQGRPLVLATIVHTIGSTYRKAGAQMLLAPDGSAAGLLSGGCLEADLMERARQVLRDGRAALVEYDTRTSDDLIWGIGLGCEGAMRILLTPLDVQNEYQPFAYSEACRASRTEGAFALVVACDSALHPLGQCHLPGAAGDTPSAVKDALGNALGNALGDAMGAPRRKSAAPERQRAAFEVRTDGAEFLIVPVQRPPRLLVLGAGPDAAPLVEIAGLMGWHITILDHRPAYAVAERFPRARRVSVNPPEKLAAELGNVDFDAAVVMSHHLTSDLAYLTALADSTVPYVGLLGPAPRRARLLAELGARAGSLNGRLRGPVGLDIGANTPETIALAIVSEIQAALTGRSGGPFSSTAGEKG